MKYDFIGIDEGKQTLFSGNTQGEIQWTVALPDLPAAHSLQRLNANEALIGYSKGYFVIKISTGEIVHRHDRWTKVTSAQRLTDGTTLITGIDLGDEKGIWVVTLDGSEKLIHSVVRSGTHMGLMETTDRNTYLLCTPKKVIETTKELKTLREYKTRGFKHPWKAVRINDGKTLVSAGQGGFMAIFDHTGRVLKKFGQKGTVPDQVMPHFYANFHFTHDGNILVANWLGHGHQGRQLLCFGKEGTYKGSWSLPGISALQGILVL